MSTKHAVDNTVCTALLTTPNNIKSDDHASKNGKQTLNFVFNGRRSSAAGDEEDYSDAGTRLKTLQAVVSSPLGEKTAEDTHYSIGVIVSDRKVHKTDSCTASKASCQGVRHIQVFLCFLLIFLAYGIRVNLSVGIVAMTSNDTANASPNPNIPTYPDWTGKSILQSSFFWGYVLPQVCAGQMAKRWGPKWFLVAAMTVCSGLSLLLPTMTKDLGRVGVMVCRSIQGFSQGFIFPSVHHLMSKWVPVNERSRVGCIVYAGGSFGTVISMIVSGIISTSWHGWPAIFYTYGAIGLVWVLLMAFFGSNSPAEHKTISKEERAYIESSLRADSDHLLTPWKKMVTSVPLWALLITHCGQNWGFWTLMTEIPTYMDKILHFDIKSNSYLSALPYFVLWLLSFLFGWLTDLLIIKEWTSIGGARKISNSVGLMIPAVALVAFGYCTEDSKNLAVSLLVVAVGANSAIYCGFHVNHMDLSPNHSGTLMGITNTISNVFSLLAPVYVHFVVPDDTDQYQWKIVFFTVAGIYVVTNAFFVVFGSGEVQPWNDMIHKESHAATLKSAEENHNHTSGKNNQRA